MALDYANRNSLPMLVLGEGSNTVFTQDYTGMVLLSRLRGIELLEQSNRSVQLRVASGENWHDLVHHCVNQGWYGLENLALIPGLVGAAPIQNIGAYGGEIKDFIKSVEFTDLSDGNAQILQASQCDFAYRDSIFKHQLADKVFITALTLQLSKQPRINISYPALSQYFEGQSAPTANQVFAAVCKIRSSKLPSPADIPNVGSFFKNPIISKIQHDELKQDHPLLPGFPVKGGCKIAAGWLIEQAGWKDKVIEQVRVHRDQALVIINPDKVSGTKVLNFARTIQADIRAKFGIDLEIEPRIV